MLYDIARILLQFIRPLFNIKIIGDRDILKKYENVVVCANHSSNWDPIFLALSFKRNISFLAKNELFKNPLLGRLLLSLNAIPIDRTKSDIKAIKEAMRELRQGGALGIFIEGTRVADESDENAKSGAIMLADKTSSPIIPVKINSTYRPFRRTVITIGEAIELGVDKSQYDEEAKRLLHTIYELDGKHD